MKISNKKLKKLTDLLRLEKKQLKSCNKQGFTNYTVFYIGSFEVFKEAIKLENFENLSQFANSIKEELNSVFEFKIIGETTILRERTQEIENILLYEFQKGKGQAVCKILNLLHEK